MKKQRGEDEIKGKDELGMALILPFCPFPPCDNPDVQPASWWTPRQHRHHSHWLCHPTRLDCPALSLDNPHVPHQ